MKAASRSISLAQRQQRLAWWFLLPALLILSIIGLYPLLYTFYLSLTDLRMGSGRDPVYIGFENYRRLIDHPPMWESVRNTLWFTVVSVTLEVSLGLAIALLINTPSPGRTLLRAAVLVPWALPTVISARMWNYMLVDTFGVVNDILYTKLQLIPHKIAWTAEPGFALASVIAVDVWKTTPFAALLFLAGLHMIPGQVYEAAAVDGATRWQRFYRITLPLLRPTLLIVIIFRTLDAMRVFDAIWVLTRGQIGTESMATYTYRQMIDFRKLGYGSAASITIFLIMAAIIALYLLAARKLQGKEDES